MNSRLAFLPLLGLAACVETDERALEIDYLHAAIIEPSCATIGCHSAATKAANLDMSTPEAACVSIGLFPAPSIDLLLRGESSGEYPQMPPDTPLPPADIDLIVRWVEAGAPCE